MRRSERAAGRGSAPGKARETWLSGRPLGPRDGRRTLSVALCYPSPYALGMSNLGFQAVLGQLRGLPGVRCERAFWEGGPRRRPHGRTAAVLADACSATGAKGTPGGKGAAGGNGTTLESGTPLSEFDIVAFSVAYENDFPNLVALLDAGGVPVLAADRSDGDALVVMGGVCAHINPEPVAPFLDTALVGEAQLLVDPFIAALSEPSAGARSESVRRLASVSGAYVPSLYEYECDANGRLTGFRALADAPLPVRPPEGPTTMAVTTVLSDGAFFKDMMLVESSRGCGRGCLFCAAGSVMRPRVRHPASEVLAAIGTAAPHTNRVGLVTAALLDHPEAEEILRGAVAAGAELNISSLRAEAMTVEIARLLRSAGVRTVTIAPETGREDLRRIIGKPTTDGALHEAAGALASVGIETLKLYFMVGLPGEREDDLAAIADLARAIRRDFVGGRRAARVSVSASAFVPKPRTAFQWLPMSSEAYLRRSMSALRKSLASRPAIEFSGTGPREARREGLLARGGRELSEAIRLAALEGVPWKAAVRRAGVDESEVLDRERGEDEVFPWEVVSVGTPREQLASSLRRAQVLLGCRDSSGGAGGDGARPSD